MQAPSPRYILTRTAFLITALVAGVFAISFVKKKQRKSAIISELKSISSDSSFFQQFYAADAQKSLIRAIGLIAEANELGVAPDATVDRCLGIERAFFPSQAREDEPAPREKIIRSTLLTNYENFIKLGYKADFHTLAAMKGGTLPAIPSGPEAGKNPVLATLIGPAISPGIDKVIANLEIRPPRADSERISDIEIAAAKRLAGDLADARIIEEPVRERILEKLSEAYHPQSDTKSGPPEHP